MNNTGYGRSTVGWVMRLLGWMGGAGRSSGSSWWLSERSARCRAREWLEGGDEAAVDGEVGSGDVAGADAGQQQDEVRDLVRPGEAPRDAARRCLGGNVGSAGAAGPRQGLGNPVLADAHGAH